jgi:hypothetical protein
VETNVIISRDVPSVQTIEEWRACEDACEATAALGELVARKYALYREWTKTGLFHDEILLAQNSMSLRIIDTAVLLENQHLFNEVWPTHPWFSRMASPTVLTMCRDSTLPSIIATWAMLKPKNVGSFWQDHEGKLHRTPPVEVQTIAYDHVWHVPLPDDVHQPMDVADDAAVVVATAQAVISKQLSLVMNLLKSAAAWHLVGSLPDLIPPAFRYVKEKVGGEPNWICGTKETLKRVEQIPAVKRVVCPTLDEGELITGYRGIYSYEAGVCLNQYLPLIPATQSQGLGVSIPIHGRFAVNLRPDVGKYFYAHLKEGD